MPKKVWIYILGGMLLFSFSLETASFIEIDSHIPDIMLIFIVFIAQRYGVIPGILTGFFIGLFIDFFSGQLLGAQAFVKMSMGFLAGLISARLIIYSFQTVFLVTVFCSFAQSLLFYFEIVIFSRLSSLEYFKGVWIDILYTIAVAPIVIFILQLIDNRLRKRG